MAKQLGIHPNVLAGWMEKFEKGPWSEKEVAELKNEQQREFERLRRKSASRKTRLATPKTA